MSTDYTPLSSFSGGVLIGLAALLLMAAHGRIAGISGILRHWLFQPASQTRVSLAFLVGLLLALPLSSLFFSVSSNTEPQAPFITLLIAGLLVGYGTVRGSGCTSGHGVCGISRLSARSLVATITFLATGIVATFVLRHVLGTS